MTIPDCPEAPALRRFSIGDLPESLFEQIGAHLDRCDACQRRLADFDETSDSLLDELQALPADSSTGSTASVAKPTTHPRDSRTDWAALVDPGRQLTRALESGECNLDRFQLLEKIGTGAFGHVFKARDSELGRLVAVKVQRAGMLADENDVQRFFREAYSAARLRHPAIVAVHDMGQTEEGICYLVTELIEGQTMAERIRQDRIPIATAVQYAIELADALQHAHREGVIHRDIKPSNLLLDADGHVHLTDFGLAKYLTTGTDSITRDGQVMGTPAYMSPEQARGESNRVDARSDVYSLCAVLYEMLTGQPPFTGSDRTMLLQVLQDEPVPLGQLNPSVPVDLERICLKGLAKSPDERYDSAATLASDLQNFVDGRPTMARPLARRQKLWRWCRRYPQAVAAFLLLFLGSIAGWSYLLSLSEYFVEQTALDSAELQSEMLERINAYYSEVVEALNAGESDQDDAEELHPGVPVPARFTIEAGRRIGACQGAMEVRLYSEYPFPWREDGGPQDDFGRRALQQLNEKPAEPVYEFTEIDGQRVVRYATARVMTESCLRCHNLHPESPKTDWAVGDVRGALEVIMPLDRDIRRTQHGLRGAFSWLTLGSLAALFGVTVLVWRTRHFR